MHSFRWWSAFSKRGCGLGLFFALYTLSVQAVVNVDATRVVLNAGDKSVSLPLLNDEQRPALVQVWVDTGDPAISPDRVQTPVVILPPVFRMQPGEMREVRILLTDRGSLSRRLETLYWLNIYQIPPAATPDKKEGKQMVILPLRIRMKLFIRPDGVMPLTQADGEKLIFTLDNGQLKVQNPTPWHMSLAMLSCGSSRASGVVVSPESTFLMPLSQADGRCPRVDYAVINDTGHQWHYSRQIIR
ncbi:fimbria/pilus periplasmic chaperone [Klebsiella oxytoca]|uniref:Fimbria/pilus periplasmic chaperone n=1 Tax=Klebsiella oxytoca TaxID=571 RepID=A0A6B8MPB0_KLEOX|nr:fimbria/pilus periplasmic chaperone [Klebsiella oxytoca]QGN36746.1 fimbria/pilus periplasmic chaperone [Klebsiella oxytoca]